MLKQLMLKMMAVGGSEEKSGRTCSDSRRVQSKFGARVTLRSQSATLVPITSTESSKIQDGINKLTTAKTQKEKISAVDEILSNRAALIQCLADSRKKAELKAEIKALYKQGVPVATTLNLMGCLYSQTHDQSHDQATGTDQTAPVFLLGHDVLDTMTTSFKNQSYEHSQQPVTGTGTASSGVSEKKSVKSLFTKNLQAKSIQKDLIAYLPKALKLEIAQYIINGAQLTTKEGKWWHAERLSLSRITGLINVLTQAGFLCEAPDMSVALGETSSAVTLDQQVNQAIYNRLKAVCGGSDDGFSAMFCALMTKCVHSVRLGSASAGVAATTVVSDTASASSKESDMSVMPSTPLNVIRNIWQLASILDSVPESKMESKKGADSATGSILADTVAVSVDQSPIPINVGLAHVLKELKGNKAAYVDPQTNQSSGEGSSTGGKKTVLKQHPIIYRLLMEGLRTVSVSEQEVSDGQHLNPYLLYILKYIKDAEPEIQTHGTLFQDLVDRFMIATSSLGTAAVSTGSETQTVSGPGVYIRKVRLSPSYQGIMENWQNGSRSILFVTRAFIQEMTQKLSNDQKVELNLELIISWKKINRDQTDWISQDQYRTLYDWILTKTNKGSQDRKKAIAELNHLADVRTFFDESGKLKDDLRQYITPGLLKQYTPDNQHSLAHLESLADLYQNSSQVSTEMTISESRPAGAGSSSVSAGLSKEDNNALRDLILKKLEEWISKYRQPGLLTTTTASTITLSPDDATRYFNIQVKLGKTVKRAGTTDNIRIESSFSYAQEDASVSTVFQALLKAATQCDALEKTQSWRVTSSVLTRQCAVVGAYAERPGFDWMQFEETLEDSAHKDTLLSVAIERAVRSRRVDLEPTRDGDRGDDERVVSLLPSDKLTDIRKSSGRTKPQYQIQQSGLDIIGWTGLPGSIPGGSTPHVSASSPVRPRQKSMLQAPSGIFVKRPSTGSQHLDVARPVSRRTSVSSSDSDTTPVLTRKYARNRASSSEDVDPNKFWKFVGKGYVKAAQAWVLRYFQEGTRPEDINIFLDNVMEKVNLFQVDVLIPLEAVPLLKAETLTTKISLLNEQADAILAIETELLIYLSLQDQTDLEKFLTKYKNMLKILEMNHGNSRASQDTSNRGGIDELLKKKEALEAKIFIVVTNLKSSTFIQTQSQRTADPMGRIRGYIEQEKSVQKWEESIIDFANTILIYTPDSQEQPLQPGQIAGLLAVGYSIDNLKGIQEKIYHWIIAYRKQKDKLEALTGKTEPGKKASNLITSQLNHAKTMRRSLEKLQAFFINVETHMTEAFQNPDYRTLLHIYAISADTSETPHDDLMSPRMDVSSFTHTALTKVQRILLKGYSEQDSAGAAVAVVAHQAETSSSGAESQLLTFYKLGPNCLGKLFKEDPGFLDRVKPILNSETVDSSSDESEMVDQFKLALFKAVVSVDSSILNDDQYPFNEERAKALVELIKETNSAQFLAGASKDVKNLMIEALIADGTLSVDQIYQYLVQMKMHQNTGDSSGAAVASRSGSSGEAVIYSTDQDIDPSFITAINTRESSDKLNVLNLLIQYLNIKLTSVDNPIIAIWLRQEFPRVVRGNRSELMEMKHLMTKLAKLSTGGKSVIAATSPGAGPVSGGDLDLLKISVRILRKNLQNSALHVPPVDGLGIGSAEASAADVGLSGSVFSSRAPINVDLIQVIIDLYQYSAEAAMHALLDQVKDPNTQMQYLLGYLNKGGDAQTLLQTQLKKWASVDAVIDLSSLNELISLGLSQKYSEPTIWISLGQVAIKAQPSSHLSDADISSVYLNLIKKLVEGNTSEYSDDRESASESKATEPPSDASDISIIKPLSALLIQRASDPSHCIETLLGIKDIQLDDLKSVIGMGNGEVSIPTHVASVMPYASPVRPSNSRQADSKETLEHVLVDSLLNNNTVFNLMMSQLHQETTGSKLLDWIQPVLPTAWRKHRQTAPLPFELLTICFDRLEDVTVVYQQKLSTQFNLADEVIGYLTPQSGSGAGSGSGLFGGVTDTQNNPTQLMEKLIACHDDSFVADEAQPQGGQSRKKIDTIVLHLISQLYPNPQATTMAVSAVSFEEGGVSPPNQNQDLVSLIQTKRDELSPSTWASALKTLVEHNVDIQQLVESYCNVQPGALLPIDSLRTLFEAFERDDTGYKVAQAFGGLSRIQALSQSQSIGTVGSGAGGDAGVHDGPKSALDDVLAKIPTPRGIDAAPAVGGDIEEEKQGDAEIVNPQPSRELITTLIRLIHCPFATEADFETVVKTLNQEYMPLAATQNGVDVSEVVIEVSSSYVKQLADKLCQWIDSMTAVDYSGWTIEKIKNDILGFEIKAPMGDDQAASQPVKERKVVAACNQIEERVQSKMTGRRQVDTGVITNSVVPFLTPGPAAAYQEENGASGDGTPGEPGGRTPLEQVNIDSESDNDSQLVDSAQTV